MARALGSYPNGRWFKSDFRYQSFRKSGSEWPVGQEVKTPPFHGSNMGSIPVRVTKTESTPFRCAFSFLVTRTQYEHTRCAKRNDMGSY